MCKFRGFGPVLVTACLLHAGFFLGQDGFVGMLTTLSTPRAVNPARFQLPILRAPTCAFRCLLDVRDLLSYSGSLGMGRRRLGVGH